jgi:hypothetical protein
VNSNDVPARKIFLIDRLSANGSDCIHLSENLGYVAEEGFIDKLLDCYQLFGLNIFTSGKIGKLGKATLSTFLTASN